ncbi:MAG: WD40/YVTN/BNR-like repeat-containing protein [Thermoanaerobaculia bacterium]
MHIRRIALAFLLTLTHALLAQVEPSRFNEMRWRHIGPFRGGRTVAAVGIPSKPNVFFIGVNNGGVWKTTDYGRVWMPIFDAQPTGSIGAIAIAPPDPSILYVGSGEGLQRPDLSTGDGIYKSTDGGKTWTHLGLRDGQQIPTIVVDPKNPTRLFVAVLGHPYGPNEERGIFRSLDGGKTFEKILYRDADTGGIDVILDPSNANIVYAALWEARQGPWENGVFTGPGSGIYKSIDGGTTWKQLTNGLPKGEALGRAGLEVAQSDANRLYAIAGTSKDSGGVYRSDDAGETWTRINTDERLWGRPGDFNEVRADPKNADVVYVANVVTWKSIDGGKTFAALRGAPGGDDYHRLWINPNDPNIILNASDQGAVITVNGGATWSSWYNQPTAQMFHINADNAFPYRVCGGQQESGSACVPSRGDEGQITYRDWTPVGVEEYGYAVPDPLDPDIVYGGRITRYDRRTRLAEDITPKPLRSADYRVVRTQPSIFSPVDPHVLYFASNTLWKTSNAGRDWTQISPDLTRKQWAVPANVGKYASTPAAQPKQRGVIYTIAPSPLNGNRIWIGTDDGLIHVTTDGGKTWSDVTPKELVPWAKVSILEASHFDENTAYAAINTFRLDDLRPHIYRTKDGGKTWTHITNGIPNNGIINVVREDHKKRGLLFAGSETEAYVSIDDGMHWQSLRLNMPASSIRDLIVKDDDIAVATHARGFWILDNIEPLRQTQNISGNAYLFAPQKAWRFRWNKNTDTPLPADEPVGQNPPEGAIIDYWLGTAVNDATLEILDERGNVVRRYSSADEPVVPKDTGNVPWYWIRPERALPTSAGMHRVTWDLRYPPMPEKTPGYPIAAVPFDTPVNPTSPLAMPGTYTLRFTAGGNSFTQSLTLEMDPRVKTPRAGLQEQFEQSMQVYSMLHEIEQWTDEEKRAEIGDQLRGLLDRLQSADTAPSSALARSRWT